MACRPTPRWATAIGWGGDPLLSTFLRGGLAETARLVFHELAHQAAYAADDSGFNEAYATAVERLGLKDWWASDPDPELQRQDEAREQRRARWQALAAQAREDLRAIYADESRDRGRDKTLRFAQLREQIEALAAVDPGYSGYRAWAQAANNAHLALLATYHQRVPAFETLFERLGRRWPDFHAEVARLARLPRAQRDAALS